MRTNNETTTTACGYRLGAKVEVGLRGSRHQLTQAANPVAITVLVRPGCGSDYFATTTAGHRHLRTPPASKYQIGSRLSRWTHCNWVRAFGPSRNLVCSIICE